jgi:hypothetical protein
MRKCDDLSKLRGPIVCCDKTTQVHVDYLNVLYSFVLFYYSLICLILLLAVDDGNADSNNLGFLGGHAHGGKGGLSILHLVGDGLHNDCRGCLDNGEDGSLELGGFLALGSGGISLFENGPLLGEYNEFGLVFIETCDIEVQTFHGSVGATVVDANSNRLGVSRRESGRLELIEGESPSEPYLGTVPLGRTVNGWPKFLKRTGGNGSRLGRPCEPSALFLRGLVQGQLDFERTTRPCHVLFMAMDVGDDIIMLHHLDLLKKESLSIGEFKLFPSHRV